MADWTDENKAALIKDYQDMNPTAETSSEIVKSLIDKYDTTVNGARMILVRAKDENGNQVYISKAKAAASTATSGDSKKESKQDSIDRLKAAIEAQGIDADASIIDKLTGKAAAYFADTIKDLTKED